MQPDEPNADMSARESTKGRAAIGETPSTRDVTATATRCT